MSLHAYFTETIVNLGYTKLVNNSLAVYVSVLSH